MVVLRIKEYGSWQEGSVIESTHTALAEDPSSVPVTLTMWFTTSNSLQFQWIQHPCAYTQK